MEPAPTLKSPHEFAQVRSGRGADFRQKIAVGRFVHAPVVDVAGRMQHVAVDARGHEQGVEALRGGAPDVGEQAVADRQNLRAIDRLAANALGLLQRGLVDDGVRLAS